jgi:membrane protease YdiL (CAAX protease family)
MVLFVIKNNIFYYALVIYFILIGTPMISYLGEEDPFWRLNGALYVILFLLPFIIWWKYDYLVDVLGLAKPQPNEEERYPENKNPS